METTAYNYPAEEDDLARWAPDLGPFELVDAQINSDRIPDGVEWLPIRQVPTPDPWEG